MSINTSPDAVLPDTNDVPVVPLDFTTVNTETATTRAEVHDFCRDRSVAQGSVIVFEDEQLADEIDIFTSVLSNDTSVDLARFILSKRREIFPTFHISEIKGYGGIESRYRAAEQWHLDSPARICSITTQGSVDVAVAGVFNPFSDPNRSVDPIRLGILNANLGSNPVPLEFTKIIKAQAGTTIAMNGLSGTAQNGILPAHKFVNSSPQRIGFSAYRR